MNDKSKILRILLVNTGFRKPFHPLVSPPLGIMYLASYIRSKFNVTIRIVNQKLDNYPNEIIVKTARDMEADIIGLSVMSTGAHGLPDITQNIKTALPGSLIVLGGPHVSSFQTDSMRNNSADVAVPGEGEIAFERIVTSYVNNLPFSDIPGIYWRATAFSS